MEATGGGRTRAWGRARLERIDRWQQRRRGVSFLVAVVERYWEDRGRQYGALLSYYGFVSLFPLLLVLVTVLGIVLDDDPDLRNRILDTVYATIPVVGAQLRQSTTSLNSSGFVLLAGLLVTLWAGLAVVKHAQDALNLQWGVPRFQRPGLVARSVRALGALAVVGVGVVVATAATSLAAFLPDLPLAGRVLGALGAILVNVLVLTVSYRVLVHADVGWRALVPGGVVGGVALWVLQLIGATYVTRVIVGASDVYGAFATMFGLLVWIALLARAMLLASEVNVVRAKRLWPRSLRWSAPTDADRRALEETVQREMYQDPALLDRGASVAGTRPE
ncbi:MAG TPA: YhjD/YihY/BrkB family envelope integrity protein [Acidimicrobiia bacterium]|nr:YhjD/YihY/BrkB family envelope integrity protein [Acidimicrobiia bacterium]